MKAVATLKPGDKVMVGPKEYKVVKHLGNLLTLADIEKVTMTHDEVRRVGMMFQPPKIGHTRVPPEIVY